MRSWGQAFQRGSPIAENTNLQDAQEILRAQIKVYKKMVESGTRTVVTKSGDVVDVDLTASDLRAVNDFLKNMGVRIDLRNDGEMKGLAEKAAQRLKLAGEMQDQEGYEEVDPCLGTVGREDLSA